MAGTSRGVWSSMGKRPQLSHEFPWSYKETADVSVLNSRALSARRLMKSFAATWEPGHILSWVPFTAVGLWEFCMPFFDRDQGMSTTKAQQQPNRPIATSFAVGPMDMSVSCKAAQNVTMPWLLDVKVGLLQHLNTSKSSHICHWYGRRHSNYIKLFISLHTHILYKLSIRRLPQ